MKLFEWCKKAFLRQGIFYVVVLWGPIMYVLHRELTRLGWPQIWALGCLLFLPIFWFVYFVVPGVPKLRTYLKQNSFLREKETDLSEYPSDTLAEIKDSLLKKALSTITVDTLLIVVVATLSVLFINNSSVEIHPVITYKGIVFISVVCFGTLSVLLSLLAIDRLDSVANVFRKWGSTQKSYDIRDDLCHKLFFYRQAMQWGFGGYASLRGWSKR